MPATTRRKLPARPRDAGLVGDRADRLGLFLGGEHRAADQADQIVARIEHRLEAGEVGLDLADRICLGGEFEQRTRIALGDTGDGRTGLGHGPSLLSPDRPQDLWREHRTLAKSLTLLIFVGQKHALARIPGRKSIAV